MGGSVQRETGSFARAPEIVATNLAGLRWRRTHEKDRRQSTEVISVESTGTRSRHHHCDQLHNGRSLVLGRECGVEFKKASGRDGRGEVPKEFRPTYSAIANTEGGEIPLGVEEIKPAGVRRHHLVNAAAMCLAKRQMQTPMRARC